MRAFELDRPTTEPTAGILWAYHFADGDAGETVPHGAVERAGPGYTLRLPTCAAGPGSPSAPR
jgi:hypothetical protein